MFRWFLDDDFSLQVESGVEIPFEKARVLKGHDSEVRPYLYL
jgi:hypothetical protein